MRKTVRKASVPSSTSQKLRSYLTLSVKKKKENNNNNVQERSFALAHEWRTSLIEVFEHSECFAIDRRVDMS